jgi:beta-xylosidase
MFAKQESTERIQFLKSKTLDGPWTMVDPNITPYFKCEGPTSVKIGNYYYVYVDSYAEKPNRIAAVRSADLIHWENYESHVKLPFEAKHGTVFKVTPDVVKMLSDAGL